MKEQNRGSTEDRKKEKEEMTDGQRRWIKEIVWRK